MGYQATRDAVQVSLQRLQRQQLDSVLIHKPRCWEGACNKQPEGTWQDSWRALQELVDQGVIRAIGICDVDDRLLDQLLQQRIKPAVIQNWMDPLHQNAQIRQRIQAQGILFQAYSSLGTQWVHFRGYNTNPVLTHPTLTALAQRYNVTVPSVIIRWGTQHGVSMLPASKNAERQAQNLHQPFTFTLTDVEMQSIDALDGQAPPPDKPKPPPKNQVALTFENQGNTKIDTFWVDNDQKEVLVGSIAPQSTLDITSFHGHSFVFRTAAAAENEEKTVIVGQHVVSRELGLEQWHVIEESEGEEL